MRPPCYIHQRDTQLYRLYIHTHIYDDSLCQPYSRCIYRVYPAVVVVFSIFGPALEITCRGHPSWSGRVFRRRMMDDEQLTFPLYTSFFFFLFLSFFIYIIVCCWLFSKGFCPENIYRIEWQDRSHRNRFITPGRRGSEDDSGRRVTRWIRYREGGIDALGFYIKKPPASLLL